MAGKVQHEIPQLYQRGFQIPSTDGKEQIYVYRRGAKPFISAINRSGAQSYFYSEPSKDGIRTLDDEITDYEGHLTTLVNELRSAEPGGQANATTAAEVISHLTTRNAHLRGAFAHGLTTMADSFTELFSDEDAVRRLIGLEGPGVTDTFRSHVVDRLAQQLPAINPALSNVPDELMTRIAYAMIREQFTSFYAQQKGQIDGLIGMLLGEAKSVAADAHRKALAKTNTPNLRTAELSTLAWRVVATDEDLILPDCVALGVERDGQIHPLMMAKLSEIDTVFFAPILPTRRRRFSDNSVGSTHWPGARQPKSSSGMRTHSVAPPSEVPGARSDPRPPLSWLSLIGCAALRGWGASPAWSSGVSLTGLGSVNSPRL